MFVEDIRISSSRKTGLANRKRKDYIKKNLSSKDSRAGYGGKI